MTSIELEKGAILTWCGSLLQLFNELSRFVLGLYRSSQSYDRPAKNRQRRWRTPQPPENCANLACDEGTPRNRFLFGSHRAALRRKTFWGILQGDVDPGARCKLKRGLKFPSCSNFRDPQAN